MTPPPQLLPWSHVGVVAVADDRHPIRRALYSASRGGILCAAVLVFLLPAPDAFAFGPLIDKPSTPLLRKADPWVIGKLASGESEEFLVVLREQADLSATDGLTGKNIKGAYVFETLRAVAERTQAPLRAWLALHSVTHQAFWIANMVLVKGDASIARAIAAREEVARLAANPVVRLVSPLPAAAHDAGMTGKSATGIEWGVEKIRAPAMWSAGYTGQGIVVAGGDTGVDWTHPALHDKYRGWNGVSVTHDYNWHDAIHASGSSCGANAQLPCDDGYHGTHTMGTMVGDDGAGNQVGVAPGARWIGCRNMDQGNGTPATYTECFQWFVAPTDLFGLNPDTTMAPHVVNNSWACPASEGCTDPNVLRTVVQNVRAAGIVVVVSAGNSGNGEPSCGTVGNPPAIYDAAFSVGATDSADDLASFSSRGPVTVDGSNRMKPDISAPGVNVRSSTPLSMPGNGYTTVSGTSMAGPHVAGAVALLLSAVPALAGQPNAVQSRIEIAAAPRTSPSTCGGVPGATVPNNSYGWGRLDAKAAFDGVPLPVLDIDASTSATKYDALTDGLLLLRYLSGLGGPALTAGALGATAARTDPAAIQAYLDSRRSGLDIDGNNTTDAATDGLLILRYLFGLRGPALIQGALGAGATRSEASIETYLQTLLP